MDRLWATWRMAYITGEHKDIGCVFCKAPKSTKDEEVLILHRGCHCFIIMNLFPYNNGHVMVIPYRHTSDVTTLTDEESLEMMKFVRLTTKVMKKTLNPEGFNIGMNIGRPGGAGIADHLHMHIVPRWTGDTNFMPVIGETRVISEHLEATYKKLYTALQEELKNDKDI